MVVGHAMHDGRTIEVDLLSVGRYIERIRGIDRLERKFQKLINDHFSFESLTASKPAHRPK